jgi:transcription elongation factor Elf1
MEAMRECPFCAHGELVVDTVEHDPAVLAVQCPECGATGPLSLSSDPAHAVFAWNQRIGRMTLVK